MTDRLLVDLLADGRMSVAMWPDQEMPQTVAESILSWPLDRQALEDLRWYLEDYLRVPFGVYEDRGSEIQTHLASWGEAVFGAVFGSGPARDAFMRAQDDGLELVFRSAHPGFLELPWELMRDDDGPVALRLAGVGRSLPMDGRSRAATVPGGRLRILMVISRPLGATDVGFRMIARPLLERIRSVRGEVDLVVLRPPTLDALREALTAAVRAGEPFQVVHFDGHGVMPGRAPAPGGWASGMYKADAIEGDLVFQKDNGAADYVPAGKVAAVLQDARVPLVVLNACQSGAMGKQVEAAVATRLLRAGAASVVAMAYSVYSVAAAEFMTAFYEALFAGDPVSAAVTAGRRRLFEHDQRPSLKGDLPLADWMVPVHYHRREVRFTSLATTRPSSQPSLEQALNDLHDLPVRQADADAAESAVFVGRDWLFLELETALRLQRAVVLHGPGGTGKTELARAFAHWWQVTGGTGAPGWMFWHSFDPGTAIFGLDSIVNEIGQKLFGDEFADQDQRTRTQLVVAELRKRPMLLAWDNFESVFAMPDPDSAARLGQAGCAALRDFLREVTAPGGASAVLITSRTEEEWLGQIRRIVVGGFDSNEATQYANHLLTPFPATMEKRARLAFGQLMNWLDGHPLSMRIILPLLATIEPEELLNGLQGTAPLPAPETEDRSTSLPASVTYSFRHLSVIAQRLLTAAGLCRDVADAEILGRFARVSGVPDRFAGATTEEWKRVLQEAARVGLLSELGADMFQIHPALPAYLATRWQTDSPDSYQADHDAAIRAMVAAAAERAEWARGEIDTGEPELGYRFHGIFTTMLGHALRVQDWEAARRLLTVLESWWMNNGMTAEADAWADQTLTAIEDPPGTPPPVDSAAGDLWIYAAKRQANRQLDRMQTGEAQATNMRILAMLQANPFFPGQQAHIADTYHQLGNIAQATGQLTEADDWYRKSLDISEDCQDRSAMLKSYHQLGNNALMAGLLDEANERYGKALPIARELGNLQFLAATYHQLGMTDIKRKRLDAAEAWYREELPIIEKLKDQPHLASVYHELGMIEFHRGAFKEAAGWHRQALAIREKLRYRFDIAASYDELGATAQMSGRPEEAVEWYHRSLAIREDIGDRAGLAATYARMGLLVEEQGQERDALTWAIRSVSLFDDIPHPACDTAPEQLARLIRFGIDDVKDAWREITGHELPENVRNYITVSPQSQPPRETIAMTDEIIARAARAAAAQLSSQYWQELLPNTEVAIQTVGTSNNQNQYDLSDLVAVANLIVAVATLAWGVYVSQRQKTTHPSHEAVARAVRLELRANSDVDRGGQDKIVSVVVTEIFRASDD